MDDTSSGGHSCGRDFIIPYSDLMSAWLGLTLKAAESARFVLDHFGGGQLGGDHVIFGGGARAASSSRFFSM